MDGITAVLILVIGGALYFLPSIIAGKRNHPQVVPIVLLNVFVGWTFLGWVVALVWSSTNFSAKNPG